MKYLALLLCVAAVSSAAEFQTGQAARLVVGQPTFTAQRPGASDTILGGVSGLAFANDSLFVVDSNRTGAGPDNNRVLIFRNVSGMLPSPTAEFAPESGRCLVCTGAATNVLGQPDFSKTEPALIPTQAGLRLPTAVASDGRFVAVSDTNNNRVLIWNRIPDRNGAPADVVVGQENFTNLKQLVTDNRSLRGPQGVWIQNGKLFVADTQNHRVLIWNSIPTSNNQPADLVLGQANFTTGPAVDLAQTPVDAKPNKLLNPVSVSSDGQRLYVADLGHNRVLIWNSIPTQNQQPADVVVGQPDMNGSAANNATKVCASKGKDSADKDIFPARCLATLDFPRYALSDGKRLYIADGGNDRVLIFNNVPTADGQAADVVLGQEGGEINQASDNALPERVSSADSMRTPLSLAWDGSNLYVSDPFNRRVLVFTPGDLPLPITGVRNAASREVFAVGSVTFSGNAKENDEVTIKIKDKEYKYKLVKDDTFAKVIDQLVRMINAGEGDPNVFATANPVFDTLLLTARVSGVDGNAVEYTATPSTGAEVLTTTGGATLAGGQNAARIAPGTIVSLLGENLTDRAVNAEPSYRLPYELGGVQVYFDGVRAPLFFVSPTQINAQIPFFVGDATSINAYIRTVRNDGRVTVTSAIAVPIIGQNPGLFAEEGTDPRPAIVLHGSSFASASVAVDGTAKEGDIATIKIEDRSYSYTVKTNDKLEQIRDGLIAAINDNIDEKVVASPGGQFTRVRLRAKVAGPEGNGIPIGVATVPGEGAQVILSPSKAELCCANTGGERVTEDNPAVPGETLILYATGLGTVKPIEANAAAAAGYPYDGPPLNEPNEFVYALAGGKTANVLFAGLRPGSIGMYEIQLELNSDIPTNPKTQLTIAQSFQVSNIVTFPLVAPPAPAQ